MLEHARAEIDQFYACARFVLQQYVLGFDVGVDDPVLFQEYEGVEDLDCECADVRHLDRLELVQLHQVVEAYAQQLGYDANVLAEYDEVLDSYHIFLVVDVSLFSTHQDIDLVQC